MAGDLRKPANTVKSDIGLQGARDQNGRLDGKGPDEDRLMPLPLWTALQLATRLCASRQRLVATRRRHQSTGVRLQLRKRSGAGRCLGPPRQGSLSATASSQLGSPALQHGMDGFHRLSSSAQGGAGLHALFRSRWPLTAWQFSSSMSDVETRRGRRARATLFRLGPTALQRLQVSSVRRGSLFRPIRNLQGNRGWVDSTSAKRHPISSNDARSGEVLPDARALRMRGAVCTEIARLAVASYSPARGPTRSLSAYAAVRGVTERVGRANGASKQATDQSSILSPLLNPRSCR